MFAGDAASIERSASSRATARSSRSQADHSCAFVVRLREATRDAPAARAAARADGRPRPRTRAATGRRRARAPPQRLTRAAWVRPGLHDECLAETAAGGLVGSGDRDPRLAVFSRRSARRTKTRDLSSTPGKRTGSIDRFGGERFAPRVLLTDASPPETQLARGDARRHAELYAGARWPMRSWTRGIAWLTLMLVCLAMSEGRLRARRPDAPAGVTRRSRRSAETTIVAAPTGTSEPARAHARVRRLSRARARRSETDAFPPV